MTGFLIRGRKFAYNTEGECHVTIETQTERQSSPLSDPQNNSSISFSGNKLYSSFLLMHKNQPTFSGVKNYFIMLMELRCTRE